MITDAPRAALPPGRLAPARQAWLTAVWLSAAWLPVAAGVPARAAVLSSPGASADARVDPRGSADPAKRLRVELRDAEGSLDPALATDTSSLALVSQLYETALVYDYLARPVRLEPGLLARLPQSPDGGLHWQLELRAGLRFAPDPLFGPATSRGIGAEDLRYSLQRLADPRLHSPYAWLFKDHISGLRVTGPLTLEVTLQRSEPDFPQWLALPATALVAREAAEASGGLDAHPVGSGPYRLASRVRGSRYLLLANPDYRARRWEFTSDDPALAALVQRMHGRPVPAIGRIEVQVIEEAQAAWLSFRRGGLDLLWLQDLVAPTALAERPAGAQLDRIANPDLNYFLFNLRDREFGGMQRARIALRRAVLMALDAQAYVDQVRMGQGAAQAWPVPSGLPDEFPSYQGVLGFDPAGASALLDAAGYRRSADHLRHWPDGRRLVLRMSSRGGSQARTGEEFVRRALQPLGIGLDVEHPPLAEYLKQARACQLGFAQADWNADGPDGEEFFARLAPALVGSGNYMCADDPAWQADFDAARSQHRGPARRAAFLRLAREAEYAGAWKPAFSSYRNVLVQPRVLGYHSHPMLWSVWQYLDVE